ncbi:MAG: hypothetical protein KDB01_14615, partial [Planctomycetaceae bacterium]|nr:hypothetical protein [Planctomycetaceae bacterium]
PFLRWKRGLVEVLGVPDACVTGSLLEPPRRILFRPLERQGVALPQSFRWLNNAARGSGNDATDACCDPTHVRAAHSLAGMPGPLDLF